MYDLYGDIAVTSVRSIDVVKRILRSGIRTIYYRSNFKQTYRVFEVEWASPFQERKDGFETLYLVKEDSYFFFGDLRTVYYSPRYAQDRKDLLHTLSAMNASFNDLIVIGSGIQPYSVYLKNLFKKVTTFDTNAEAVRFGRINARFNGKQIQSYNRPYNFENAQVVLSIMPSKNLTFHLNCNFDRFLIFYITLELGDLKHTLSMIKQRFGQKINYKVVRKYSKYHNIYRFIIEK